MKKRAKRKRCECVYCGKIKEVSREHVIPKCLFKHPYPPNLITVQACDDCNNAKSLNDDFLRDFLVCDIFGNESPLAREIFHTKMLSSTRQNSSVIARSTVIASRVKPFYTREGIYLGNFTSVPIDSERVKTIFSTLVRGLYYDARRTRFPDDYVFTVHRYHPLDFKAIWQAFYQLRPNGPRALGDVFGCAFLSSQEDSFTTFWLFWFYERVFFSVSAMNTQLLEITKRDGDL